MVKERKELKSAGRVIGFKIYVKGRMWKTGSILTRKKAEIR